MVYKNKITEIRMPIARPNSTNIIGKTLTYYESKQNKILIDKTDIEDSDDDYGGLDDQAHYGHKYQPPCS